MNAPLHTSIAASASATPYVIPLGEIHPPGTDYVGMWYTARRVYGVDDRMLYGTFEKGGAQPQWYSASHRYYDGIAGIAMTLQAKGVAFPDGLPKGRDKVAPTLGELWKAARLPLNAPAPKLSWRNLAPELARAPAALPVTVLLDIPESDAVEICAKRAGVSSTVWLLWTADRAVRELLFTPDAVLPWIYPVNLRGVVQCERESMNHCGGFAVTIAHGMSAVDVREQVSARLARLEHWRQWFLLSLGSWVGQRGINLLYRLTRPKPGKFAGSYSNVGSWSAPAIDGLTGSAPGSPGYPVCITTMVCNGRRGIAIRLHPVVDKDGTAAVRVLARWREVMLGE